ncbi:MAG TPA: hypothetical protein VGL86_23750 [Polyangia bacterium]|jgi:hypothetical protein
MKRALFLLLIASSAWADPPDGGASVSVVVDPNGDTTVDVKRGTLKVKSGGGEERVGAGETVRAQKGKPLRRLLAAPAATAPADEATLNVTDVALTWRKVPGAARYVVEIAAAPEMSGARTETVDGTRAVMHLETGTWYWRVVALDGDGMTGKRAPARRLMIDVTPPKLKAGKPQWR